MIAISDAELHQAFQREYPKDLSRTTEGKSPSEYDYDRIEAEKLVGKKWEDIGADLLQKFFDVASFLNPRAFQYFFPAFIKQSQVEVEKTRLLVDSLISMLADGGVHWPEPMKDPEAKLLEEHPEIEEALDSTNENDLSAWRQERWKLFTIQQWELLRKWLDWIQQEPKLEVDPDILRRAIKNADTLKGVTH
jgi:hypothetical protein